MNREELLGWINSLIINSAELGEPSDAKSWGYEEGILISRSEAEEIRTHLSLPPAEGAEEFLRSHKISGADFVYTTGFENMVELLREFAAQPQLTAEGAEEIQPTAYEWHNYKTGHSYVDYIPHLDAKEGYVKTPLYTSLHAQRIAEKMVSNESAGAILLKFQSFVHNHMNGFVFDAWIIEYLKTREK